MSQPPTAIRAVGISKSFSSSPGSLMALWLGTSRRDDNIMVLNGLNLSVPHGEFLGVVGRNGAGKSTLLRVLGGVFAPDSGQVTVDGELIGLFELGGIGNSQLTGREFVDRYLQFLGVPRASRFQVIEEIAEFAELGQYFDQMILTYSAGMAARLFFSAATALQSDIYLVDEILSVGDEHFQVKSWARMRDRLAAGASGVLVTHDWSAVIRLCRNAALMVNGRFALEGPADRVIADYLELVPPKGKSAYLNTNSTYFGRTHEHLRIDLEVVFAESVWAELAISIEYLELGLGWEPVVLSEFQPVGGDAGRYDVVIEIPSLPLSPGDYALSIFLRRRPSAEHGEAQLLDVRSWTYGNGLSLIVAGEPRSDLAPLTIDWVGDR